MKNFLDCNEYLEANYNIVVYHQVPWSLKINMLDFGAWMAMKSKVKKYHCRNSKQHDALSHSSNKAWRNRETQKLTNIWNHLLKVLDIIIHD